MSRTATGRARARPALAAAVAALVLPLLFAGCAPLLVGGAAVTGVLLVDDRRSTGTVVEDNAIELRLGNLLAGKFANSNISVTAFNRVVLLTGEVPSEAARAEAERLAREWPNVRTVQNELQIAGPSTLAARSNDTFITGRVKARLVDLMGTKGTVQANHVTVHTQASVVYLMGLVSVEEADAATEVARTTSGVRRVVRMFEFIKLPPKPAAKPEPAATREERLFESITGGPQG
jgi:osmotically-inducible protein OsmY